MTKTASPPTVLKPIPGPDLCDLCGKPGLKTELIRDPFIYGADSDAVELSADIPVHSCLHCSISFTGEEAAIAKHEAVCQHLGVLTPREIRALRRRYNMSRAAFARLTGFGEATLARWERREIIQNTSNDKFLRLLEHPNIFRMLSLMSERLVPFGAKQLEEVSIAQSLVALKRSDVERYRIQATRFSLRLAS